MADEATLIDEARRGAEEAFHELLRLHQGRVRAYLSRFLRDRDAIDDLAQDTFLTAYRGLSTYTCEAPFALWLLRIAKNRALTHLREEERRRGHVEGSIALALGKALARHLESDQADPSRHEQELTALRGCIQKLPPHSATLVADYYFRRRQAIEIARDIGKKHSAVWMALLRIREALRQCVQTTLASTEVGP